MCILRLVGNGEWGQLLKSEAGENKQRTECAGLGGCVITAVGSKESPKHSPTPDQGIIALPGQRASPPHGNQADVRSADTHRVLGPAGG